MLMRKLLSVFNNLLMIGTISLSITTANAVVNTTQSRLVFNENSGMESLTVINSATIPALVQIWTDDNDPLSAPDRIDTPVIAVPPLFKLAPAESRNLRIMLRSRDGLPKDRERIYWLNIYQIPPSTPRQTESERKVIFPLRIRLKVFIRPVGLKAPDENIGEKLNFKLRYSEPRKPVLNIENPTPYYITIAGMRVGEQALKPEMIAPYSSITLPVNDTGHMARISWRVIDDYGKQIPYKRELRSP
ncbi:fimbria/pilus periplasmic chaperone [Pantoea anthophila]|uniref:fimbria/pilus periplasmic chaperone n=1 Tax=Pantoea anthophila TaxID=470931 RepID=UPI000615050E|nr:fimbria/pilus periplasmic chaperone [Pantoea anthophila]KKB02770.1 fimbrial chaperone protein [Pantoea anthophila]